MTAASEERAIAATHGAGQVASLLLITRDHAVDDGLAREAAGYGYRVKRVSLLATEPGANSERLSDWLLSSQPPETAVAWTSRRAAEALVRTLSDWSRAALGKAPLYALGAESAAPARQAGLKVRTPEEALGASQLAKYIAGRAQTDHVRRVVFLHGDHALQDLPDGLKARGIEVTPLEVYRTRFLSPDVSEIESALNEDVTVAAAFFSPSGVEALERLLTEMGVERLRKTAVALARGATTHEALRARGYRNASYPRGTVFFHPFALQALRDAMRNTT
jgi:uroporphyrinogen III methyltransferase/synthase